MSRFRSLLVPLRAVVQRSSLDQDLDDELRYHLEKDVERLVAAGMSPRDAATTARRAFGNVTHAKEEARDAYTIRAIDLLTPGYGTPARQHALAQINAITPRDFATLGGSIRAGRDFTNADRLPGQAVAIISAALPSGSLDRRIPLAEPFARRSETIH